MPDDALTKAKQVFKFLKAYAERRIPIKHRLGEQLWSQRLSDWPEHPTIEVNEVLPPSSEAAEGDEGSREAPPLVRVRRPNLTKAPVPPSKLSEWLNPGWQDPFKEVRILPERNRPGGEGEVERLEQDPERIAALDEWRSRWDAWAEKERPARRAMQVFESLYELHGRIQLESERVELMIADGRFRVRTPSGVIDHPILLQRVELLFDASGVPELTVVDADRPPELYVALLSQAGSDTPEVFRELQEHLEKAGHHPMAGTGTSEYLKRVVQQVNARGRLLEPGEAVTVDENPTVARDPALFLRVRMSGFPAAFERVLEDLERRQDLPVSLIRLVGVTPPEPPSELPPPTSPWGEPEDVLLSKPANEEQVAIARALDRHRAVLVQGPPGTGKSHTIANLVGHLVAHGKRVLVTSHATKALRVLRGQLDPNLQPLCVAVLENDLETRSQMEQSVRGILSRLTSSDEERLKREGEGLEKARATLNETIRGITADLRLAREGEYQPIVIAGEPVDPAEAARWIGANQAGNDWIPGPVAWGAALPLTEGELVELYGIHGRLSQDEETEIDGGLPPADSLPSDREFVDLVRDASFVPAPDQERWWAREVVEEDRPTLEALHERLERTAAEVAALESWQRRVVEAGHAGGAEREIWVQLRDLIQDGAQRYEKARPALLDFDPWMPDDAPPNEWRKALSEILGHVEGGGGLGKLQLLMRPQWRRLIESARINGSQPKAAVHFRVLGTLLGLKESRRKVDLRWSRQAEPIGLPKFSAFSDPPEQRLAEYAEQFNPLLQWWREHWTPVEGDFEVLAFRWQDFRRQEVARGGPDGAFERDLAVLSGSLTKAVHHRLAVAQRAQAKARLEATAQTLAAFSGPVSGALRGAVLRRDAGAYEMALREMALLRNKVEATRRRKELLAALSPVASAWAEAVRARVGVHGGSELAGAPASAWRWRQLRQELDRRAKLDEERLMARLVQAQKELRRTTAELIDRRAWLGQLQRTDLKARQALQGWSDTQRRIGKGTGRRAPELRARARALLSQARDAVPVWIMPMAQVAESFDPRNERFDVVIVDEASQSDATGLLCWYLGNRVAVVGDHEQVSPLGVGQELDLLKSLITEHLSGIPNSHLYDGRLSLYDLARQCFGGTIALREHFRCVPDIIEFSNGLCYEHEVQPLRNPASACRPHLVEYVVGATEGADRSGKTNVAEARVTAAVIQAMVEMEAYAGRTLGAITLLGDEQAQLIQQLTVNLVGAVELTGRRFVAGNPAQFQGDERDVVLLSMVDAPTGAPQRMRQEPLLKQRYNVATSRAKDQLWLVHSLDPGRDLQPGDLRRRLIEHVRDPGAARRAFEEAQRRAESPFEEAVIRRLVDRGYRVVPQVWIGRYRVDMLVGRDGAQVVVECDGDRFHPVEKIPEDLARQAVLERAGWQFVRLRGTRFYRDPEGATKWLREELGRRGVSPVERTTGTAPRETEGRELRDAVIRRAQEIMREREWLPSLESQIELMTARD